MMAVPHYSAWFYDKNSSGQAALMGLLMVVSTWECLVIDSILNNLNEYWRYSYLRKSGQAEIDLVLVHGKKV
ncbi:MAG: hypothetical protein U5L96_09920 [Owenweeksia sp.]|nr:hypothetical protein [Owenweeksia sp.]